MEPIPAGPGVVALRRIRDPAASSADVEGVRHGRSRRLRQKHCEKKKKKKIESPLHGFRRELLEAETWRPKDINK